MGSMTERTAGAWLLSWKRFDMEDVEDHLGAALIQPGDSVIIQRVALLLAGQAGWNRVNYVHAL